MSTYGSLIMHVCNQEHDYFYETKYNDGIIFNDTVGRSILIGASNASNKVIVGPTTTTVTGIVAAESIKLTNNSMTVDNVGNVKALSFEGAGSGLSNLNATNVTVGVLQVARGGTGTSNATGTGKLVLNNTPIFDGVVTASSFTGSGAGLSNLDATNVTAGVLQVTRGGTGTSNATGTGKLVLQTKPIFDSNIDLWNGSNLNGNIAESNLNANTTQRRQITFALSNGYYPHLIQTRHSGGEGINTNNAIDFNLYRIGNFGDGGCNMMSVTNAGVGINNMYPTCHLDVVGDIKTKKLNISGPWSTGTWLNIENITQSWSTGYTFQRSKYIQCSAGDGVGGAVTIGPAGIAIGYDLSLMNAANENVLASGLTVSGNVGIGIATPTCALDVAGDIKAKNMTLNSNCIIYAKNRSTSSSDISLGLFGANYSMSEGHLPANTTKRNAHMFLKAGDLIGTSFSSWGTPETPNYMYGSDTIIAAGNVHTAYANNGTGSCIGYGGSLKFFPGLSDTGNTNYNGATIFYSSTITSTGGQVVAIGGKAQDIPWNGTDPSAYYSKLTPYYKEALRIAANGNVGINVSNPTGALEIGGDLRLRSGSKVDTVVVAANITSVSNQVRQITLGIPQIGGFSHLIQTRHNGADGSGNNAIDFNIYQYGNPGDGGVNAMSVTSLGVGINNLYPTCALDVVGACIFSGAAEFKHELISLTSGSSAQGGNDNGSTTTFDFMSKLLFQRSFDVGGTIAISKPASDGYLAVYPPNGNVNFGSPSVGRINTIFSTYSVNVSSDDRLKNKETFITNALSTLTKLRPQNYDKYGKIGYNPEDDEFKHESGLIAQEIYYDAPELRHILSLPHDASSNITDYIPSSSDPTKDPVEYYSTWGSNTAGVDYTQLIPWTIQGINELVAENDTLKADIADLKATVAALLAKYPID